MWSGRICQGVGGTHCFIFPAFSGLFLIQLTCLQSSFLSLCPCILHQSSTFSSHIHFLAISAEFHPCPTISHLLPWRATSISVVPVLSSAAYSTLTTSPTLPLAPLDRSLPVWSPTTNSSGSCVNCSFPAPFPIFFQCSLLVCCEYAVNIQHISIILPEYSVTIQNVIFTNTNKSTFSSQHWYFKTGTSHLDDTAYTIEYAFKTDETEEDKEMSNLLLDMWSNFAATG